MRLERWRLLGGNLLTSLSIALGVFPYKKSGTMGTRYTICHWAINRLDPQNLLSVTLDILLHTLLIYFTLVAMQYPSMVLILFPLYNYLITCCDCDVT